MIAGIGIDNLEIARFERLIENTVFLDRVFSCAERDYIKSRRKQAAATAAGLFCAKEAFSKAIGCGLSHGLLEQTEIIWDRAGKPFIRLTGELEKRYGDFLIHLAITHSNIMASAVVVMEEAMPKNEKGE